MSYATWPEALPRLFMLDGLSFEEPDLVIRSETDAGPAKLRPRYTAGTEKISGSLTLSTDQIATLRGFFRLTLRRGTLPFVWTDPRDLSASLFRFVGSFRGEPMDGWWRVSFTVERMPL